MTLDNIILDYTMILYHMIYLYNHDNTYKSTYCIFNDKYIMI